MKSFRIVYASALAVFMLTLFPGCNKSQVESSVSVEADAEPFVPASFTPVEVTHKLGTTVIKAPPIRVAALDMNEVDYLDQLGISVAGMPKDFVPHFLHHYGDDKGIADLGAIVQPNMERIYGLKPDLVLMTSIQASQYQALSELAPTLHFDIDYQISGSDHFELVKKHLLDLGDVFGKQTLAQTKVAALDSKIRQAKAIIQPRTDKAMVVLHNNGAFRFMGIQSRYGFIYTALGVKAASESQQAGLHGQPISNEFILASNPDIVYVIDRTAVMERRAVLDKQAIDNPLWRQTTAWKTGRIIFVDPEAWYITGAGPTSLNIMIDDVLKAYSS